MPGRSDDTATLGGGKRYLPRIPAVVAVPHYEPADDSLDAHPTPDWFRDAKLGIFVHWGIYSVPAWAPDPDDGHAYAEWYPRYMYEPGTPTHEHHRETYGEDVEYLDFVEEWDAAAFDPGRWADFFADVGARYVVLTAEHHDGFPLWDSHYTAYNAARMGPERDLVGEVAAAVRERGLRFAPSYHANLNYYQPGFSGPFGHPDFHGTEPFEDTEPGPEYVDFMNAKHRELIRRYEPDLLWFDTPQADAERLRVRELLADFYNRAEEWDKPVAVNDRSATDYAAGMEGRDPDSPAAFVGDFATPEYASYDETPAFAWEACRGIGHSFGYNAREGPEDHLAAGELVELLVDVVSKNGNLLINVGPRADGRIPDLQREPLEGLGAWLDARGDAIFATRPWAVAEDEVAAVPVRYTWRSDTLYAIALEWPGEELALGVPDHVDLGSAPEASLLTRDGRRGCSTTLSGSTLTVDLPAGSDDAEARAHAIALEGVQNPRKVVVEGS